MDVRMSTPRSHRSLLLVSSSRNVIEESLGVNERGNGTAMFCTYLEITKQIGWTSEISSIFVWRAIRSKGVHEQECSAPLARSGENCAIEARGLFCLARCEISRLRQGHARYSSRSLLLLK